MGIIFSWLSQSRWNMFSFSLPQSSWSREKRQQVPITCPDNRFHIHTVVFVRNLVQIHFSISKFPIGCSYPSIQSHLYFSLTILMTGTMMGVRRQGMLTKFRMATYLHSHRVMLKHLPDPSRLWGWLCDYVINVAMWLCVYVIIIAVCAWYSYSLFLCKPLVPATPPHSDILTK